MARGVERFEDLYVFKEARKLTSSVWKITRVQPFCADRVLVNQLRRATLSIVSNIAEGFERQSNRDFARYLAIAKGSCGEVRAQLLIAKEQFAVLSGTARLIGSGLANLARYLRNSAARKQA